MKERPYQTTLIADVDRAWASGARNVLMRLDTGGGKTFILSTIANRHAGAIAVIAHRQELVSSLSMALASYGLRHNIIASSDVRRAIAALHIKKFGRSYFDPGSRIAVASVDTLIKRKDLAAWAAQVTLWIVDEGHHLVLDNKWHTAVEMFTNPACRGLLPTATPRRADGKGLGRHADGVADVMVEGPPMRWLVEQGYLSDYTVVCPESDLQMLEDVGVTGDWSPKQLKEAAARSHIVGDTLTAHRRWVADGQLCITFSPDVDTAERLQREYTAAGLRAAVLTGKTDGGYRRQILDQYERRQITDLAAVDIVSEGFDLPAIEVGIMDRPTQSLAVYMQQFGRLLRPIYADGYDLDTQWGRLAAIAAGPKPKALLIDQVGNFYRHGPPDRPRVWTLDRRDRKGAGEAGIPMRTCTACSKPYERFLGPVCPYCGVKAEPATGGRSSPEMVDGDLVELDAETLARLRGAVLEVDQSVDDYGRWLVDRGVNQVQYLTNRKRHVERQEAQAGLRAAMEDYVRRRLAEGKSDRQIHRSFFLTFGMDVLSARALGRADAEILREKVTAHG